MIRLLTHPIVWMIGLMPFIWIDLAKVGGFTINLPYAPAFVMLIIAVFVPGVYSGAGAILRSYGIWLLAYVFYLPILTIALAGSEAQGMPIRQMFFMTIALVFASWIAAADTRAQLFRVGGALGLILVVVVVEVLARRVGLSWIDAILRFATTGDLNFIIYGFFRRVFNAMNTTSEVAVGAAAKNALAVAVFTAGVLFRAGYQGQGRDRLGVVVTCLILGLLAMLNTRSVMLMALLSLPMAGLLALARRGGITVLGMLGIGAAIAAILLSMSVLATSENALLSTFLERFSFNDASASSRFDQLEWAIGRIEYSVLAGAGYGEIGGHPVHNLFIGAWMHAGLPAFLLVVTFYLGLVFTWARFVRQMLTKPESWKLRMRAEWIAVLPLVPMFRVWLSGDAGHMNFVEWIAIAAFLATVAANRSALAELVPKHRHQLYVVSKGQSA